MLYKDSGFSPCVAPGFVSCTMLEGVDFNLSYFPLKHLGYKALLRVTGELFAQISEPRSAKLFIGVSSKLDYPQVEEIWQGACEAAREFGYADLGLDIGPSLTGLCISVSAVGKAPQQVAVAPKSKDLVCITNNAGAAFLGSQLLEGCRGLDEKQRASKLEKNRMIVGAYLKPELSPATVSALVESGITPSKGYFCTRGLGAIVRHLSADTGLGVKIYADRIPLAGGSVDLASSLNLDPLQAALRGGDDCCLLYVIPLEMHERLRHDFQAWEIIGHMARPEVGTVLVSPDGLEHEL